MSLLGNQVYANPSTPIWLSSTGGTIDGNVTIDGNLGVTGGLDVSGNIITAQRFSGGGITPVSITATTTVIPQNGGPISIPLTPTFTPVAGAEYDIQLNGYWKLFGGLAPYTPAANDTAYVFLSMGLAPVPDNYDTTMGVDFAPAGPKILGNYIWATPDEYPFKTRARITGPFTPAAPLSLQAEFAGSGTYTGATVSVVITTLDIVRVK